MIQKVKWQLFMVNHLHGQLVVSLQKQTSARVVRNMFLHNKNSCEKEKRNLSHGKYPYPITLYCLIDSYLSLYYGLQ